MESVPLRLLNDFHLILGWNSSRLHSHQKLLHFTNSGPWIQSLQERNIQQLATVANNNKKIKFYISITNFTFHRAISHLRTGLGAVHNGVAFVERPLVIHFGQPFGGKVIP
jgi:hypothetical protein